MELRQLRQFVALAETLNFHRAARRLHMSQPPLSVSIRKLETELGVALFERDRRTVRLSDAARAALDPARAALHHADVVAEDARSATSGLSGRLRIGFVGSATYALMPRVLPLFRDRYPGVRLEMHEETNARIVAKLESGDLDIGLVRIPFTVRSRIRYVAIESDTFMAAVPASHRLARKKSLRLKDFMDEPFIHYAASDVPGLHAVTMLMFEKAGFTPRVAQEAFQVATVICLVESGLGVALVPTAARRSSHKGVVFRPLVDAPPKGAIGLAVGFDPGRERSAVARFRELVESSYKGGILPS